MFQKEGSSTSGGNKKDAPLRKSDRRKLRDRVLEVLFINNNNTKNANQDNNGIDGAGSSSSGKEEARKQRSEKLIDDAILASKGGDVLSRKLKLPSGEHATLFLRTPSPSSSSSPSLVGGATNDTINSFPITWPYLQSTQPILLEYEDAHRKIYLIPLLSLLAALPPPDDDDDHDNDYRIPTIAIHPQVSKYICRGADLMKSGIRSFPPPHALRNSKGVVKIAVIGNPTVCAVGIVEGSLFRDYCYGGNNKDAGTLVGPGKKGVGVTIISCYGDDLWKSSLVSSSSLLLKDSSNNNKEQHSTIMENPLGGGRYDDGNFGNVGFVDGKFVYPIQEGTALDDESSGSDDGDEEGDEQEQEEDNDNNGKEGNSANQAVLADDDTNLTNGLDQLQISDDSKDGGTSSSEVMNNQVDDEEKDTNEVPQQPQESQQLDHDEILSKAFFTSLLQMLSSKTPLPIPVSIYFAKHLLSTIPQSTRLDMKQTTYKKIGPFLLQMESRGIIKLGASKDKKDKCAFLTGIVKSHPELIDFKRQWKKDMESNGGDISAILSAGGAGGAAAAKKKLAVVELYIVPRHISDGMQLERDEVMAANAKAEERKGTGFLTKTECRLLIETYIEKEELVDTINRGSILVNGPLCDALYRASKKDKKQQSQPGQESGYPTTVKRKDLIERWLERMEKGFALVEMPGSKILNLGRGEPVPVLIEVEFRQGNRKKFLTRLRGVEEYGIDAVSLSGDVANRFACASNIESSPVGRPTLKKGRVELVFQGHLSEELVALLTGDEKMSVHGGAKGGDYAVPKNVIKVEMRKGVPARKRR